MRNDLGRKLCYQGLHHTQAPTRRRSSTCDQEETLTHQHIQTGMETAQCVQFRKYLGLFILSGTEALASEQAERVRTPVLIIAEAQLLVRSAASSRERRQAPGPNLCTTGWGVYLVIGSDALRWCGW